MLFNINFFKAHQFAHQWFVNVVSQKYWQHSWLDEGICVLFEYNDLVNSEWRMRDYFIIGPLHAVLHTDSLDARPINIAVDTPQEIASIFDEIGLNKGLLNIFLRYLFLYCQINFSWGSFNYAKKCDDRRNFR